MAGLGGGEAIRMHGDSSLDQPFDPGALLVLRGAVEACARRAGIPEDRVADVVLAVHELMANAIRHGAGKGRLRVWRVPGALRCQVDDEGAPAQAPPAGSWPVRQGHGLWVVRQIADQMEVLPGPGGTRAIIAFAVPAGAPPVTGETPGTR
jgi:serine/threonine-protein kinase RsbW